MAKVLIHGESGGGSLVEKKGHIFTEDKVSLHEDGKKMENPEVGKTQMASSLCKVI